jgi:hypothetical protein
MHNNKLLKKRIDEMNKETSESKSKNPVYMDPPNKTEILKSVQNSKTHDEVVKIINKTFPGWIMGWPRRYCMDYPHFQNNWEFVCKKTKSKTLSVIIVDHIEFKNPKYTLIKLFSELLTVFGHSVRRKEEFLGCKICGDAIPTEMVYRQLLDRKISVPSCWMLRCKEC